MYYWVELEFYTTTLFPSIASVAHIPDMQQMLDELEAY